MTGAGWRARVLWRAAHDPADLVPRYALALGQDTADVWAAREDLLDQPTDAAAWRRALAYEHAWREPSAARPP